MAHPRYVNPGQQAAPLTALSKAHEPIKLGPNLTVETWQGVLVRQWAALQSHQKHMQQLPPRAQPQPPGPPEERSQPAAGGSGTAIAPKETATPQGRCFL